MWNIFKVPDENTSNILYLEHVSPDFNFEGVLMEHEYPEVYQMWIIHDVAFKKIFLRISSFDVDTSYR